MQYIVYCDESEKNGAYFGNFYGGALVRSIHFQEVRTKLESKKQELNLFGEVKWQKVTPHYLEKYMSLMEEFFNFIQQDKVKIRIMFTHNMFNPAQLSREQRDNEYFLLYYQFFSLFVTDIIPPELKRIIEFLNEQMNPAEVLGVEVKQYTGRKEKTLVSRVVGQTMRAIDTKKVRSGKPRQWDRESLLLQVQERAGDESVRIVDHVLEWAETHNFSLKYGKGAHEGSATIGLDLPGGNYCRIITVNGGGSIAPNFDMLLGFPPFDQREMRLKMLNKLGRESNIRFDPNKVDTWSNRPLSPLADENHFHAFCKTLEWVRGKLEEHHRLAGAQSG